MELPSTAALGLTSVLLGTETGGVALFTRSKQVSPLQASFFAAGLGPAGPGFVTRTLGTLLSARLRASAARSIAWRSCSDCTWVAVGGGAGFAPRNVPPLKPP